MLDAAVDATLVCRYNDLDGRASDARAARRATSRRSSSSPSRTTRPGCCPDRASSRGCASLCDRTGALLDLRRGHHRLPPPHRRLPGDLRRAAGLDDDGQGDRQRLPARRDRRTAASTSSASTPTASGDVHFGGTYNGERGRASRRASRRSASSRTARVHEHVFALGERMRAGLAEIAARVGVPAVVGGFGSLFVLCFMEGELESYEDVLRNDTDLFVRYRRELIARGVFEMPESLGPQPHQRRAHRAKTSTARSRSPSRRSARRSTRARARGRRDDRGIELARRTGLVGRRLRRRSRQPAARASSSTGSPPPGCASMELGPLGTCRPIRRRARRARPARVGHVRLRALPRPRRTGGGARRDRARRSTRSTRHGGRCSC